jgi:DNA-binding transcriptional LysR family regulator
LTTIQLPRILKGLKQKFPNAELAITAGTSQALVEKIMHGDVDVAFVSLPVENSSIVTERLFSDEIVAIAHPLHPLGRKRSITVADLAAQKLILGERGGNTRRMIDDFFIAAGLKPNVVMELSRQEAINQMVEADMGVGTAGAKTIADEIREGRLISWTIEGAQINWELGLARLRGGYFSPIAKEFTALCKESFVEKKKELKARR